MLHELACRVPVGCRAIPVTALATVAVLLSGPASYVRAQVGLESEQLVRGRMEAMANGGRASAGGERLHAVHALPRFYEARGFGLAWEGEGAAPSPNLQSLLESIDNAGEHGLDPDDYHRTALRELLAGPLDDERTRVELDLLATDAFLVLGSHLLHGRVNPETIDPEWIANRRSTRMDSVLAEALPGGRVEATLAELAPRQPRYRFLMEAAARLRTLASRGGWSTVPDGPKLELGSVDPRVEAVRARLVASGDAPAAPRDAPATFDLELEAAVRRFQARHGLDDDGVVGAATLAALNVPAEERARTVELNLERWRWLPDDLGDRHIEVNIAAFRLDVVERGRAVHTHRVVVGRQYRQTPMFSGTMTYLVLSPFWHVPPTIAAVDKLPLVKRDPAYLRSQHMSVLDRATNVEVDPASIDWTSMTGPAFNERYRLRQDPGAWNALGGVKLMFPNRHSVYLHDTPSRELFARTVRSFSSGCIRVEDPLALTEYVLSDPVRWPFERIREAASQSTETTVRLERPVPVHLLYWTALASEDGTIHFREDLYGRDGIVARALAASPPGL